MEQSVFQLKTQPEILDGLLADFTGTVDGIVAQNEGDDFFDLCNAAKASLHEHQKHLVNLMSEAVPATMTFATLQAFASPLIGDPVAATPAEGTGTATGAVAATWADEATLIHPTTAYRYKTTAAGSIGAGGTGTAYIEAIDAGDAPRLVAGEILYWEAQGAGMNATIEIAANMTGGSDAEKREPYLNRLYNWLRNPDAGGTAGDFEKWAKTIDGVGSAAAFPNRRGLGTCDVAVLDMEGDNVTTAVLSNTQDKLDEMRPCTSFDEGSVYAVHPVLTTVDLTFQVRLDSSYQFSSAPDSLVSGSDSSATEIHVTDAAGYIAGQWVAIIELREAREILSVDTVNDILIFGQEFSEVPVSGYHLTKGCAIYDALAETIRLHFLRLAAGETYYSDGGEGALGALPWVLSKRQTLPTANNGDVEAIVTESVIQALRLGTLRLIPAT